MSGFSDWILALDFDGVIWDSVGECFVMARRAYQEIHQRAYASSDEAFRAGRWLVRTGGDFLLVLELAHALPPEELLRYSKSAFQAARVARAEELSHFEKVFYRLRLECREQHFQEWTSFQQPYAGFLAQYPELKQAFRATVLCTTKDEASARGLLASGGLEMDIWGREKGVHKGDQIRSLCAQFNQAPERIVFIDDLLENLEQVHPCGCRCLLADWGYNTPAEQQLARQAGYRVVSLPNLLSQLG